MTANTLTPRRALLSVSDKTGLAELAQALAERGVEIVSSGGTARSLRAAGLAVTEVADITGFPEMLDGRVKTLHPAVHAGILARRDLPAHAAALEGAGIAPIDLVVVNLYPFRETVARPGVRFEEAVENIDVGGPTLLRAAAKNHADVAAVCDPADYPRLIAALDGGLSPALRLELAQKAFAHTAAYDAAVSAYFAQHLTPAGVAVQTLSAGPGSSGANLSDPGPRDSDAADAFPARLALDFEKVQELRYGENPHQRGAFYRAPAPAAGALAGFRQRQGKELSYNNLADADAAWECVKTFDSPACVIVKHANPCGVAVADGPAGAYRLALATDPTSAFGGIIAFNRELDEAVAVAVLGQFAEVLIAPAYAPAALERLAAKGNLRVLEVPLPGPLPASSLPADSQAWDLKRVGGGLLVQSPDVHNVGARELRVVTRRAPDEGELRDLLFAWRVAKFVKSNAIVFCRAGQTLGVGAGQMSRVDSTRIAALKAGQAGLDLAGSVVASDAFFPFRDGVDVLAEAGARAVIQPGGSLRDDEVIAAADAHGLAMVVTGVRHFRH